MPRSSSTPDRSPDPASGADVDARDYDAFAEAQDPLDIDAATWAVRRRRGLDDADAAALEAWLAADPRHREALEDMEGTLGELQHLSNDAVASLRTARAGPEPLTQPGNSLQTPIGSPDRPGRRRWLASLGPLLPRVGAMALVLTAVAGGWIGWDYWRQRPVFEQSYATVRGKQQTVELPDGPAGSGATGTGSRLQLDTATRIDVSLYRDRREVRLLEGQAMFSVRAAPGQPFHVWAGPVQITVVGTRFSVRHTASGQQAGQTVISVEEGKVRVARSGSASGKAGAGNAGGVTATRPANDAAGEVVVLLVAGQRVTADQTGQLSLVEAVPPAAVAPWRDGRVNFDQTPLAQAIAEFERYGRVGLAVPDPAVAAMLVGGSYSLTQWQRFAETLPQMLPVQLVRRGGVTEVVARETGNDGRR